MSVGNWRNHILVKCKTCYKLMGYFKDITETQCMNCDTKQMLGESSDRLSTFKNNKAQRTIR